MTRPPSGGHRGHTEAEEVPDVDIGTHLGVHNLRDLAALATQRVLHLERRYDEVIAENTETERLLEQARSIAVALEQELAAIPRSAVAEEHTEWRMRYSDDAAHTYPIIRDSALRLPPGATLCRRTKRTSYTEWELVPE